MLTAKDLAKASLSDLEALYTSPDPRTRDSNLGNPGGFLDCCHAGSSLFQGRVLCRLNNAGARAVFHRFPQWLMFERIPFGIDFGRNLWFFFGSPRVAMGRFEVRRGPSRWRTGEVLQLHYERSRLAAQVRGLLYDEVKPLAKDLLLGLGGTNADRGRGDHFFFSLTRR